MIVYRTNVKNINCLVTIPSSNPKKKVIILCSGLPGQPENYEFMNYFTDIGYICIHPKYEGTWESYGKFLDHSPVEDIVKVVNYIDEKKSFISAYDCESFDLDFNEIVVFGSSFGGSISLVSGAKNTKINKIVSISPVIDYSKQGEDPSKEQNLTNLGTFIKKGYGRAYDFDPSNWNRLTNGEIDINPIKYTEELKERTVLLIHGEKDTTVSFQKAKSFFEKVGSNKSHFMRLPDEGHISFGKIKDTKILKDITDWIEKN